MILKSKNTETIIEEKGYIRKLQPKAQVQKYNHPKEKLEEGSKKEILKINKVLKLFK